MSTQNDPSWSRRCSTPAPLAWPRSVELRDTHISWVFLAGDLAYKVKKPIVFPFLDYGTVERRHEMCREEVRLNRRLAPEIYLGVVGIARAGDRYALCSEDDPAAVEYAVEMRRVEEDRSLAALAARGVVEPAQIEAVAACLARFHSEADEAAAEFCDLASLDATLDENLTTLRAAAPGSSPSRAWTPPSASRAASSAPGATSSRHGRRPAWSAIVTATCAPST